MKLEDATPPLELCKKIPQGEFEDSIFLWVQCGGNGNFYLYCREDYDWSKNQNFPAPTLHEIMQSIIGFEGWGVDCAYRACSYKNPVEHSLTLWLQLKGIK